MPWYFYFAYFFAGVFLVNGIPHVVQGICGNQFQTPFASPPGVGQSSALVNVAWGWLNWVIGSALVLIFFPPPPPPVGACIALALGALIAALALASHFAKVRNNAPHP